MKIDKTFEFDAIIDNLDVLNEFLEEALVKNNIPMKEIFNVEVPLEEIYVNICHYAYGEETGQVKVIFTMDDNNKLTMILEDSGTPYNPLEKEDPDVNAPIEERGIGGLGIYMTKKMMDNFEYKYKDGKNINILEKVL